MRQAHSNNIPKALEYLGMNEWAVRWNIEIDPTRETSSDITPYVYDEEIFHIEPTYDLFVTTYIRYYYTVDQEDALKSNMLTAMLSPEEEKSKAILLEWEEFEVRRNIAKEVGRQIFNVDSNTENR